MTGEASEERSTAPEPRRSGLWLEYALVVPILASLFYTVWFFRAYHYLPQPFFYEPSGTWMDWFSLTAWSHKPGAYDVEGTIYPPLTFVLMRVFSIAHCYALTRAEEARDCDWVGIAALCMFLVVAMILTFMTFWKVDRKTAIPRSIALSFGFPMLFGFERGNLVFITYSCMLLAFGPLIRSARIRWLFAGFAVNFKVYLVSAIFAPLLRRKWVATEGMILAVILVYVVTWKILGEGNPYEVYHNVFDYSQKFGATAALDLWFASSYIPLTTFLTSNFPLYTILSSNQIDLIMILVPGYIKLAQGMILLAAFATWLRPEVVPTGRIVYLAIALALSASEAGGYTEILLLMFVFMERWRGTARPVMITLAYILCISADFTLGKLPPMVRWSYLGGTEVIAQWGVGVMSLLRPGLMLMITIIMAGITIRDVWDEIKVRGLGS